MEEENEIEQANDSPTAGDNGFVHIQSLDSAQIHELEHASSSSIDQVERLEQDDGVVVSEVDTVQDEPPTVRAHEDGEHDEFEDCPDALVAPSPGPVSRARQLPFRDDTEGVVHMASVSEREVVPQDNEEERSVLMKEVSNLHHQLKVLSKQQTPADENDAGFSGGHLASETGEGGEKSVLPLREMVNECSKFVELYMNERSQANGTIRELSDSLHMKDKEIEDLTVRANEQSISQDVSSFEATADRILSSLSIVFGETGLSDTSVSGKLSHVETNTSFLLEKYQYFLSEVEMLAHCLAEVRSDFQMQNGVETVFLSAREELMGLKRKELELNDKTTHLEYQQGQLMEQLDKNRETVELLNAEIGKLKGEVEQEKTRYSNSKEKLSMAVTKGKALVQQRDSLKQSVTEKTGELERCLFELQEKSTALQALESRNAELTQTEIFANSLQEALSQRDMVLGRCAEILSLGLPEATQFPNLESQVSWLLESYNLAKDQFFKLQDDNNAIQEASRAQIDHLTASLLAESQERYHLKEELEEISSKYEKIVEEKQQMVALTESSPMDKDALEKIQILLFENDLESKLYEQILEMELDNRSHEIIKVSEELRVSKDEINTLQINFQRSEEKASLLREKLSLAVKKGKGLVQERENMKQQMAEKHTQIEALMADFQKQESTLGDLRDQVAKAVSERDQIGQYLAQSNTTLQEIIETIDGINIIFPIDVKEPVEKVKWFASYLSECHVANGQAEQELGYVKDEAAQLVNKLTEALTTVKSLEDALSVSENNVSQLSEEKSELEISKTQAEQEVEILKEEISTLNNKLVETLKTMKSVEDKLAGSEKTISLLTEEKSELETAKSHVEAELHKAMEEVTFQTSKFQEALSLAENNISLLMSEKEEAQMEVQKVKEEVSSHASNLDVARKTIKSLEDGISQLKTNVSQFSQENEKALDSRGMLEIEIKKLKEEAEQEISTLKTELSNCRQELAAKNDKQSPELSGFFGNLQVILKDESLMSLLRQSFEKKIKSLNEMQLFLKDMKDNFDSVQLQDHLANEESFQSPAFLPSGFDNDWNTEMIDDEFNAEDPDNIGSYVGKTLDNLNTKNQNLADQFGSFSTLVDDMIASLLKNIDSIRNALPFMVQKSVALQQNVINMQMDKQIQDSRVAMLEIGIKESKDVSIELQGELEKTKYLYNTAKEENEAFQRRVHILETELEASGNLCSELSSKLEDYRAKENEWNESKRELSAQSISSIKDHEPETENALISALQTKTLFEKIEGITIPFMNLEVEDEQPQESDPVEKLFYIVDNVYELLDQLTLLTNANEELRSTLSRQALEVDELKGEFKDGLLNIIQKLGVDESVGVKKPADVAGLVLFLERVVQGVVLNGQSSRSKLVETQKIAEDLSNKVKLLEDFIQKRTGGPDTIQERGVFEGPSLPTRSEISEIDDQVPVGKVGLPLVSSAAQMRSLRKGSNDQLAITIDSESERLLDKTESVEDKGHIFKSLHTSGLVPVQGKMIADRIDGIWVSGGQALMRRPRARLGLIAYWLVLHIWLLGAIL